MILKTSYKIKMKEKNSERIFLIAGSLLLFLLLYSVNKNVGMYFDDYGNASLSYGYDSSSIIGTNYTLKDMFEWSKFIYLNWGGRLIYAWMLILLLKNGVYLYMLLQTLILIGIYLSMYFVMKIRGYHRFYYFPSIIFALVYCLMRGDILSQGVYWASASCLYVWPMLPVFVAMVLLEWSEQKQRLGQRTDPMFVLSMIIIVPLVTLSHEQIGAAFVAAMFLRILIPICFWHSKIKLKDLILPVYSLLSFLALYFAPGNTVRMKSYQDFDKLPVLERYSSSFYRTMRMMTNNEVAGFNLLLFLMGLMISILLFKMYQKKKFLLPILGLVPYILLAIIREVFKVKFSLDTLVYSYTLFFFIVTALLLYYCNSNKDRGLLTATVIAGASIIALIFSPVKPMRSELPFIFSCMMVLLIVSLLFLDKIQKKELKWFLLVVVIFLAYLGLKNHLKIIRAYAENIQVGESNFHILKEYKHGETIHLKKYPNDYARSIMPYDKDYDYIEYWMKEYFNLPKNVSIQYE